MTAGQPGLCGKTLSHAYSYLLSASSPSPLSFFCFLGYGEWGGVSLSFWMDMHSSPSSGHTVHTHCGVNGASFPSKACTTTYTGPWHIVTHLWWVMIGDGWPMAMHSNPTWPSLWGSFSKEMAITEAPEKSAGLAKTEERKFCVIRTRTRGLESMGSKGWM